MSYDADGFLANLVDLLRDGFLDAKYFAQIVGSTFGSVPTVQVRLWQLGDLEHNIMPGPQAFETLRGHLRTIREGGEGGDIVWDPTLKVSLIESAIDGIDVVAGPEVEVTGEVVDRLAEAVGRELAAIAAEGQGDED